LRHLGLALFILFSQIGTATTERPIIDYSSLQNQFEQKIINRLQLILDPTLGAGNYSIVLGTTVKKLDSEENPKFFSKLGVSTTLPLEMNANGIRFENWVEGIEVTVSYSSALGHVDLNEIKKQIESTLKSVGKIKFKININTFLPLAKQNEVKPWPWTSIAIAFVGIMIFLALIIFGMFVGNSIKNLRAEIRWRRQIRSRSG